MALNDLNSCLDKEVPFPGQFNCVAKQREACKFDCFTHPLLGSYQHVVLECFISLAGLVHLDTLNMCMPFV